MADQGVSGKAEEVCEPILARPKGGYQYDHCAGLVGAGEWVERHREGHRPRGGEGHHLVSLPPQPSISNKKEACSFCWLQRGPSGVFPTCGKWSVWWDRVIPIHGLCRRIC